MHRGSALFVPLAVIATLTAVSARQLTFRAGVDLTTFSVTVVDKKGGAVADLQAGDFEVIEDGRPQTIRYFAHGDAGALPPPMHLGLLVDASGSMEQDLQLARGAAIKFLNMLPEAEDITLVDFDTAVRITRYPQRDFPRLIERIRMRKPEGATALYDAVGTYLDGAADLSGRTIMVMYTDGADTQSASSFSDALTLLKASQVTVFAVGLVENAGSARGELRLRLQQMAEATGGRAFFPTAMREVESAYEKVLAEIRAQYHLGYLSTGTDTSGAWRKVEIRLKRPDLRVRARRGYFGPFKAPAK